MPCIRARNKRAEYHCLKREQLKYCYDTRILSEEFMDKQIRRFDLIEDSGDKAYHFHFQRNSDGKCVMNYKLKRYSHAVYPRKYPHLGATHISPIHAYEPGKVTKFECFRDVSSNRSSGCITLHTTKMVELLKKI